MLGRKIPAIKAGPKPFGLLTLLLLVCIASVSISVSAMDLLRLSGKKSSLEDLHKSNMWTLVMVWSLDCVACEEQKPVIDRFHQDHHLSNAQVVGLASDGDQFLIEVAQRVNNKPLRFKNYVPRTESFEAEYLQITGKEFHGTPTYLLFKPGGELVGVHAGTLERQELEDIVGPAETIQTPSADLIR